MKYQVLPRGVRMPLVGLGTLGQVGVQQPVGEVRQAVEAAIQAGYRYLDCAWAYKNEGEVGEAVGNKIKDGTITREDMFVVSKLHVGNVRKEFVRPTLMDSLRKLNLKYLDLWLIHGPMGIKNAGDDLFAVDETGKIRIDPVDHMETWREMEKLLDEGLIKYIGLSNFNSKQIKRVYDNARIKPVNLQVECHIYFQQRRLHEFCQGLGMSFTAYAPLGSPGRPDTWKTDDQPNVLTDETLKKIADKKGKKPSQIALRFLVEEGISVIPKSTNPQRIKDNIDIFDFELSPDEMTTLRGLDQNHRIFKMEALIDPSHPDNPELEPF